MTHPKLETCATHGLRYDPSQQDGCVLCRRLVAEPAQSDGPVRLPRFVLVSALGLGALALLYFVRTAQPSEVLAHVPSAAASCVAPLVDTAQRCLRRCGARSPQCLDNCMAQLNDTLDTCAALPKLGRLGVQMLYGSGRGPGWALVRYKVQEPIEKLTACTESRGTFTARVAVREAQVSNVAVGTHQRDAAECIAEQLKQFDAKLLGGGTYEFIVRAQPPEGRPMAPPDPPPNAPTTIPWPSHSESKPEEALGTQVLSADFQELQSDLRMARAACTPRVGPGCAPALSALRPHFAVLTPSERFGSVPLALYELDRFGVGFDCVRVEHQGELRRNTALGMIRPSQQPPGRWLIVPTVAESFSNLKEAETKGDTRSEFLHLHNLRASELSVCFTFDQGASSHWRLGMATYHSPPSGEPYDWHSSDIKAFGLKLGKPAYEKLREAIIARDVSEVQRLLAAGTKLDGIKGPLALAVRAQWPNDKLEILLRAKASPHELDEQGNSAMHAAATANRNEDEVIATLRLLKQYGGNVNLMLMHGTPLHWIAQYPGRDKVWDALIQLGGDPYLPNDFGQTAMELRCICRR